MTTKVCPKCGIEKPIDSYHKDRTRSSGYSSHCSDCDNKRYKERYKVNRDKILQKSKQKRLENPEKQREANKRWREKHPDVAKQRQQEYYWNNTQKERERVKNYHKNNPEKARESRKRWKKNNPDKVKEKSKEYARKKTPKRKMFAIEYKGGKCEDCGIIGTMENRSIFDFHHIEPSIKENDVNEIQGKGLDKLKQELDKCVLLCSNCHRLRHQHYKDGLRDTL